ncbi:MAG: sigma-70 family RNA polymerase sigma factor [Flavobacteriales bacterium]|nr:sigma-70 family RNA polymerase sigma factor [Flavobacteriales bacterium]
MGIWHPHEEAQLVDGCKSGSRTAQEEVFNSMYRRLLGVCMRYADDDDEAKDILQNGFIKVFKSVENYKGDGSFEGWVKRIVINTAIDNYRRKKVKPVVVDSELTDRLGSNMEEEVEDDSIYQQIPIKAVLDAVQYLSPAYRTVFNLYVLEGYNHNEIAEMLTISVGTSKSNLSKARLNLRKMLKPLVDKISQG